MNNATLNPSHNAPIETPGNTSPTGTLKAPLNTLQLGLVGPVPPPSGGMAMQTEQLARLLRAEGLAVELLASNGPYRPACAAKIPVFRALFRLIPFLYAVWRLAGRVDVIHLMANSGWSWQLHSAPVLWLSKLRATPVVVNYRGGEAQQYFQRSFKWVRPSLRKAAAVVVPSGYLQDVFQQFGEATRIIPNIIDQATFHPLMNDVQNDNSAEKSSGESDRDLGGEVSGEVSEELGEEVSGQLGGLDSAAGSTAEDFVLVITRNLEAIYGIETAIRAFAQVFANDPSLRLRIAGSGPAEASLRALVQQLGVADAVTFVGRLDRPGIVALYAQADAMLNPSTVDNMPNSVLEALACGLPVISTNVGGVPYIVRHGETALLVPPGEPDAMAEAIRELKNDAVLRRSLREKGLAEIEQYSWPRVRQQWLDLYASLQQPPQKVVT